MFGFGRKKKATDVATTHDAPVTLDTAGQVDTSRNPVGRALVAGLDRAVRIQGSTVENYLNRLREKNPGASTEELQSIVDKHFRYATIGSGAGAGGAAAIPGVGLFTGAAAIGAESLVFLDAAALYTVASASLRGIDIRDPERRRALVLIGLLGSSGTAIIDALLPAGMETATIPSARALTRFSAPTLNQVNNRLTQRALKTMTKRMTGAVLGKLMPMGIGAVVGSVANRRLAASVIDHVRQALGPAQLIPEADQPPAD